MAKGQPFSVRLSSETEKLVLAEAKRTKRSKSAVVEALTEEAARARLFPGIAFRGDDARRRAWVIGGGLDVSEIVEMLEDHGSIEKLLGASELTLAQVRLATTYRDTFPIEIDSAVAENRRSVADLRALYPFVEVMGS
ncbi:MAG: hypothetical protein ACR2ME_06990 [Acidimicrobiia bacterium]